MAGMRRVYLLALVLLAGCGGSGGSVSLFIGQWSGFWQGPSATGTMDPLIDANGNFTGGANHDQTFEHGFVAGTINLNNGAFSITFDFPTGPPDHHDGVAHINTQGELVGNGPGFVFVLERQ